VPKPWFAKPLLIFTGMSSHDNGHAAAFNKDEGTVVSTFDLYSDQFSKYVRHPQHATIELRWLEATKSMSEEQFREGLERLAELLERERVPTVLIDVTNFTHQSPPDFLEWRETHIIPRYNEAGVKKLAFLLPPDAPGTMDKGIAPATERAANFPTGYFGSRELALSWLGSSTR
jgi:hypothetical protein